MSRAFCRAFILLFVLAASPSARAQELDSVKALLVESQEHYRAGRFRDSVAVSERALLLLAEHEAAWQGQPRAAAYAARAWLVMAFAKEKLVDVPGAIAAYEAFLTKFPDESTASREEASTSVSALRSLGFLVPEVRPANAQLEIDGRAPKWDAQGRVVLSSGDHVLTVDALGHIGERRVVSVAGGNSLPLVVELARANPSTPPSWPRAAAWTTGGVGLAAIVTGVACLIVADGKRQTIEDAKDETGRIKESELTQREAFALDDDANDLETGAVISFIMGGVAAGAATVFFLLPDAPAPPSRGPGVGVVPRPGGAVLEWSVTF